MSITTSILLTIPFIPSSLESNLTKLFLTFDNPSTMNLISGSLMNQNNVFFQTLHIKPFMMAKTVTFHNLGFYINIALTLFSVSLALYAFTKHSHNKTLTLENQYLQTLSEHSDELLFKFNPSTEALEFLNYNKAILSQRRLFEKSLITHLKENTHEGVKILQHESKNKQHIYKVYHLRPKPDSDYILGKVIDVEEEVKQKKLLIEKSQTDGLTGLSNAIHTKESIDLLIRKRPLSQKDALIVIDLDNFKGINDSLGHLQGDKVLIDVAVALNSAFKGADIIGRIGGDEFMVYMTQIDFEADDCPQIALLGSLLDALEYPLDISASVGICIVEGRIGYEEAFTRADLSLYDIKSFKKSDFELT